MIVVTCSLIHSHNIVSAAETSLVLVNLKCFEHYYLTALMTPETDKQLISDLRAQGPGGASLIRLPDCPTARLPTCSWFSVYSQGSFSTPGQSRCFIHQICFSPSSSGTTTRTHLISCFHHLGLCLANALNEQKPTPPRGGVKDCCGNSVSLTPKNQ